MEVTTLVIAVFGAVTGAASLGWSVASHFLSGGRVVVELRGGWAIQGGIVTQALTLERISKQDRGEPVLVVRATNTGRLPVTVNSWAVRLGKVSLGQVTHPLNSSCPRSLGVGEGAMWVLPLAEAFNAVDAAREAGIDYEELRAVVTLGAGKERRSRRSPARASDLPKVFGFTP